ncbi:hypothetical protein SUDANB121_01196 [Nocardiopsis dassonvillei]|uniref:hypothetical protein n=1 Tax=Nocardiopsis dassonvillei TaxID=2014 RepID=UPI003F5457E4
MTHPIPRPRTPLEPLAKRRGARGPHCQACEPPSCRRLRARNLPLLGGHRAEYLREHRRAATLQVRHPHLVIWFGEATGSYWVASFAGLAEVPDTDTLTRLLGPLQVGR